MNKNLHAVIYFLLRFSSEVPNIRIQVTMQWKTLLHVVKKNVDSVLDTYVFVLSCCIFIVRNWRKA